MILQDYDKVSNDPFKFTYAKYKVDCVVQSCICLEQLEVASKMINNFNKLYGHLSCTAVGSLRTTLEIRKREILNAFCKETE